jgi:hypothetical protein
MENLTIGRQEALSAYDGANDQEKSFLEKLFGKSAFEKDIVDRLQTFSDVLEVNGTDPVEFEKSLAGLSPDEVAYRQIKEIVKAYNQGWIPDWDNSNETKYVPWFDMRNSSGSGFADIGYGYGYSNAYVGSRLCFSKRKHAEDAGKKFTPIYKNFFVINK